MFGIIKINWKWAYNLPDSFILYKYFTFSQLFFLRKDILLEENHKQDDKTAPIICLVYISQKYFSSVEFKNKGAFERDRLRSHTQIAKVIPEGTISIFHRINTQLYSIDNGFAHNCRSKMRVCFKRNTKLIKWRCTQKGITY